MVALKHDADRAPDENQSAGLGFWKFLLVLCLAMLLFLLGQEMVRHHFFTGGSQNYRMGGGW